MGGEVPGGGRGGPGDRRGAGVSLAPTLASGASSPCPDEAAILAFVEGRSGDTAGVEEHLAGCAACRQLVSALAPTSGSAERHGPSSAGWDAASRGGTTPGGASPRGADRVPIEPGEVIAEKYQVERVLGQGGMGVVVRALHLTLRRPVALKFLRASLGERPDTVARFFREARAAAAIDDEHVVRVLDAGRLPHGGQPYLVLELLEGEDLAAHLRREGPLPIAAAVDLSIQVCKALSLAHARGIVHRDIKPANLFLTRRSDGTPLVKVLDFGIAKVAEALEGGSGGGQTSAGTILGSPSYMAPEQLQGGVAIDPRADVWAAGVVLFELLTGRLPFEGTSVATLCAAILTAPARAVRSLRPDVPAELETVLLRCWAKEPAERTPTMVALAQALAPFASDLGEVTARWTRAAASSAPPPPPGREAEPPRGGARVAERASGAVDTDASAQAVPASAGAARSRGMPWLGVGAIVAAALVGYLALTGRPASNGTSTVAPPETVVSTGVASAPPVATAEPQATVAPSAPPPSTASASPATAGVGRAKPATDSARPKPVEAPAPTSATPATAPPPSPTAKATAAPAADPVRRDGLLDRK